MGLDTVIRVGIGPIKTYPSWNWIGPDTAEELSKYFAVELFDEKNIPDSDVLLLVKHRPQSLIRKKSPRSKLIYMPIDFYISPDQIREDRDFLRSCSTLMLHCDRLRPFFQGGSSSIWNIDHHNKYGLLEPVPYRKDGYILWIGGFQYVPYVLKWAAETALPFELKILTDYQLTSERGRERARDLAQEIGVPLKIKNDKINEHSLYEWSVPVQESLLMHAKAAVDIKGGPENFSQWTKPPTKAQKYMASGIPFATNSESYAVDYFKKREFQVSDAHDFSRWFSPEYHFETVKQASALKKELSLASVGAQIKRVVESVSGAVPKPVEALESQRSYDSKDPDNSSKNQKYDAHLFQNVDF